MKNGLFSNALAGLLLCVSMQATSAFAETLATEKISVNVATPQDQADILTVLANYTKSVSDGDRALFESQLLDVTIPFSGVGTKLSGAAKPGLQSVQDYSGFRRTIFDGGKKFHQQFSNVTIQQLGNLAQVSLDYQTALQGEDFEGKGWKVLQLIKVHGQWKIASEFFTDYPNH